MKFFTHFLLYIFPYILHPTRVTGHSETIIDNTFISYISQEAVCFKFQAEFVMDYFGKGWSTI